MVYTIGWPFLLWALSQKTKDWNGCDPNGCIVKINVNRRVFQDVKKTRMVRVVYGLPSGFRPARFILSWASCMSRSVNIQLGFAVPGVSGRKKYASTAIGRDMIPLMTNSHLHPARPALPLRPL
jgi:hypothetical protein